MLQRSDLRLVLLQQPVDGSDIVLDLLDGPAHALGTAGDGDQLLARLDLREIFRNGIDVGEHEVEQRVLLADHDRKRVALILDLDGRLFRDA